MARRRRPFVEREAPWAVAPAALGFVLDGLPARSFAS
jgi:hypothetical protein